MPSRFPHTTLTTGSTSSKAAVAYENLRAAIFEVQLPPGTKLPEDALAETFGMSRTGIRTLLQRLAHERLVDLRPNRGAIVAQPSVKEAREVFASRRMIECSALPTVISQTVPADIEALRALLIREDEAQGRSDRATAIRLSGEFHTRLIALTQNGLLAGFADELVVSSSLIIATYGRPIAMSCRHSDHKRLLDLIESRDVAAAIEWMDQHLKQVEASCVFIGEESPRRHLKQILVEIAERRGAVHATTD